MIKLLKSEFQKTRRRYVFLSALVITALQLVWALYGNYDEFNLRNGWLIFLYQLPLINSIFMPVLSIIVASRICDIEHKGHMLKQLAVIRGREEIYDAKLIYGLSIVLFCCVLSWTAEIVFGYIKGFWGAVPIDLYLLYLLFTAAVTTAVYVFQHTLSILFKNQAVAFLTGIIGTFCGLFALFLPSIGWLRKSLIWGYYGALDFVGLFGWTKETRYDSAYFAVMDIDWVAFGVIIAASAALYIIGTLLFRRKEI